MSQKNMKNNEKRIVRKSYKNLTQTEIIRQGNSFVDDFLFEDNKAVDTLLMLLGRYLILQQI